MKEYLIIKITDDKELCSQIAQQDIFEHKCIEVNVSVYIAVAAIITNHISQSMKCLN